MVNDDESKLSAPCAEQASRIVYQFLERWDLSMLAAVAEHQTTLRTVEQVGERERHPRHLFVGQLVVERAYRIHLREVGDRSNTVGFLRHLQVQKTYTVSATCG